MKQKLSEEDFEKFSNIFVKTYPYSCLYGKMDEIRTTALTSFTVEWPKVRIYCEGMIDLMKLNPDKHAEIFEFFSKLYPQDKERMLEEYQKYLQKNKFMTNTELISMSEKIGNLLFKVARFTKEDFENDPDCFVLLLKGLFNAGCKNLIFEIKEHFISLGISEEILNERGGMFFDEYLINQHIAHLKEIDDMIETK